jgi:hypothetical protein
MDCTFAFAIGGAAGQGVATLGDIFANSKSNRKQASGQEQANPSRLRRERLAGKRFSAVAPTLSVAPPNAVPSRQGIFKFRMGMPG